MLCIHTWCCLEEFDRIWEMVSHIIRPSGKLARKNLPNNVFDRVWIQKRSTNLQNFIVWTRNEYLIRPYTHKNRKIFERPCLLLHQAQLKVTWKMTSLRVSLLSERVVRRIIKWSLHVTSNNRTFSYSKRTYNTIEKLFWSER